MFYRKKKHFPFSKVSSIYVFKYHSAEMIAQNYFSPHLTEILKLCNAQKCSRCTKIPFSSADSSRGTKMPPRLGAMRHFKHQPHQAEQSLVIERFRASLQQHSITKGKISLLFKRNGFCSNGSSTVC